MFPLPFLVAGAPAIAGGAFALGLRHGIDWDHIAAITDITSTTASVVPAVQSLTAEPGVAFTDESRHGLVLAADSVAPNERTGGASPVQGAIWGSHRVPIYLATLYAIGHGTMVVTLGLFAILFAEFLPAWIDPLMERVVGATLVVLGAYLFYALFRYFRSGEEFRLRSRWMLVFDGVGELTHRLLRHRTGAVHQHLPDEGRQYGWKAAYGVGLIHGVGAETGTQVLVIGTAVGANSKWMGVVALFCFVGGLLVSNSVVTVMTATGFVSARKQRLVYIAAGIVAAAFSLVLGLLFLSASGGSLPSLDPYLRWIGGPD